MKTPDRGTQGAPDASNAKFRKPLGLVLSGGGALGAWQAGCLKALLAGGLAFDHVLGLSVGALNGALYALGREEELLPRWRDIGRERVLRLAPRRRPPTLFSGGPLWAAVDFARDDQAARREARCELTVASLCLEDGLPAYARFSPPGKGVWEAPLASWLVSSCSIPWIFPPVLIGADGEPRHFIDGGVPGREWLRFDALAGCRDVLVCEMVRADEIGRRRWGPLARFDQKSREILRRQVNGGIESLRRLVPPPRVFRLCPSERLDFYQLSFRAANCLRALELGSADAADFLKSPRRYQMG